MTYKIILLGPANSGKTTFIHRYIYGVYNQSLQSTIGGVLFPKSLDLIVPAENTTSGMVGEEEEKEMKVPVKLGIWDTAGQERFNSISANYYKEALAAVIAFDLTDKTSLDNIERDMSELEKNCSDNIVRVLVGMKSDRRLEREINKEEAEEVAHYYNMKYFESSSKIGRNVEEVFMHIAQVLYDMDR